MQADPMTRHLPSLREHLEGGPTGEGFAEWAAVLLATQRSNLPENEKKFARIFNTFVVACVEQMNREAAIDPSREGVADAIAMWSRAAGYATIMAVASVSEDDAPLRRMARVLAEDFKVGAKMAADACARAEESRHAG